jgi:hypothetical protein
MPRAGAYALLPPDNVTGIVKTAPWQLLSEALLMVTEPESVKAAEFDAETSSVRPV